jgi:UDP-N-acetylmuramate--alanine ligase
MLDYNKVYHFVGIGGIGMSALAFYMRKLGYNVKGSDLGMSKITDRLKAEGITVFKEHRKENIDKNDVVIYSSAISDINPEIISAKEKGLTLYHRSQVLFELLQGRFIIGVTGTHGKTTTTYFVTKLLRENGINCGMFLGGWAKDYDSNFLEGDEIYPVRKPSILDSNKGNESSLAKKHSNVLSALSNGVYAVELDESDQSFLRFNPQIKVVTNIDSDHLESYNYDFSKLRERFLEFLEKDGINIICGDDKNLMEISKEINNKITYGFSQSCEISAKDIEILPKGTRYKLFYKNVEICSVNLDFIGRQNVLNSLAAISVLIALGKDLNKTNNQFLNLKGIERRFEVKFDNKDIKLIEDYAHHPQEIESVLKSIKEWFPQRRLIVVFQPHRYTRTKLLWNRFLKCFSNCDLLYITDIYPAFEKKIEGINSKRLASQINHSKVNYIDFYSLPNEILKILKPSDIILILGAGNIYQIGDKVKEELKSRDLWK